MSEYEWHAHRELALLVADGDPAALAGRGEYLLRIAPYLAEVGQLIATRINHLEFRGQAAGVMQEYAAHFRRESLILTKYSTVIGHAMITAAQALSEAKTSMPPESEEGGILTETMAENLLRQEAINVITRLDNNYRTAATTMAQAEEPHFQPLAPSRVRPPDAPSGPPSGTRFSGGEQLAAPAASAHPSPFREGATQNDTPVARRPEPDGLVPHGATMPAPPPVEEQINTHLDSVGPAPGRMTPEVPTGDGPPIPSPGEDRRTVRDSVGLPLSWRRMSPGIENGNRATRPTPPAGPTLTTRTPPNTPQRPTPAPVTPGPHHTPVGRPPTNAATGPPPGQGPMTSPPPSGGNSSRAPVPGILGGIPRQTTPQNRRAPQGTAIGTHTTPALRDPATGMVNGPGGTPVSKPPRRLSSQTPTDQTRRRKNRRDNKGPSEEGH